MRFSVVIPTYNRTEILKHALECFQLQDFPNDEFEIIIVDDAGEESAEPAVREFASHVRFPVRFFTQKKAGQGVARNFGVSQANGDIVIFTGDDIFAAPDFLKEHAAAHADHPDERDGVLGYIDWHPKLEVTPLMEFMTKGGALFGKFGGHQFAFDLLEGKTEADYRFFYTSNISLKRSLLLKHPFDPWFSSYGWEDIELGYRLAQKADLTLHYRPTARAYHYHPMLFSDFERRMKAIGKSAVYFQKRYPELNRIPSKKKQIAWQLLGNSVSLRLLRAMERQKNPFFRNLYYYALSKKYFLEGVKEAG